MTMHYAYEILVEFSSVDDNDQKQIDNFLNNSSSDTITKLTDADAISISRIVNKKLSDIELVNLEQDIRQEAIEFAATISEGFLNQVQNAPIESKIILLR